MNRQPWHIAVLIPARNEEQLLPRCLESIAAAIALLPSEVTADIVIAVDRSSDRTLEIARRMIHGRGVVITTQSGIVGRARGLAARTALGRYRGALSRCWLANTDADSSVPADWMTDHLTLASENIDAIAGTVDVDSFEEHSGVVAERFRSSYVVRPDGSHSHVHGANLGVRADAYLRAGGWKSIATAEDHDLWNRLEKTGANRISISRLQVLTSGRRVGRAPHGFADTLAAHNEVAT
ncbi:MAG TPA: glycosyltransferase [Terriglobales bacterium]|jgi:glycosyltransferase involved in cell wall biosynthesis|nr:glycosyltransferase [Terriglobales bacterium]